MFTINMVFAQISPPAGVPLFVSAGIADIPIGKVFVPVLPFLGATAAVLVLITYVPDLVLFRPRVILP